MEEKELIQTTVEDEELDVGRPFYNYSLSHAQNFGETKEYYRSYNDNLACKKEIEDAVAKSYDKVFGTLPSGTASSIAEEYGVERTAYLLAVTINDRLWDGRLSMENRAWAVGVGAYFQESDYAISFNHNLTTPSDALNKFVSQFRKERQFDPTLKVMGTERDPYPFVYPNSYKIASWDNELPQFFWSWGVNCKCAQELSMMISDMSLGGFPIVLQEFGPGRVSLILAETLDYFKNNTNISENNKAWGQTIILLPASSVTDTSGYLIQTSAAKLNDFLDKCLPVLKEKLSDMLSQAEAASDDMPEMEATHFR